jgi:hypothetical protein
VLFSPRNVTVPSGVFTFWTVDSGFEQFNPVLELEVEETRAVPEPASIVLVTTALAACDGRRRRAHSPRRSQLVRLAFDAETPSRREHEAGDYESGAALNIGRGRATNRRRHGRAMRRAQRLARFTRALSVAIPVLAYIWR